MGLTQVSTDGVKNDAITKTKIPANQIEASELANNAVDTNAIADQAVALSKLPHGDGSSDGKFLRANNGADPSFETVSIPAGTTINNNADNRVITGSGTANTLNGEANLTFNSSLLVSDGNGSVNVGGNYALFKRTSANTNYINAPLSDADLVVSADNNVILATNHSADFNSTERMRITAAGQVAIKATGTTSTSVNLLVYGDSDNSDIATFSGGDWSRGLKLSTSANGGQNDQNVIYDAQGDNGQHIFKNDSTEAFQMQNGGNFNIVNGNLVVASGHGIDFSATSGSGTSELLDDYEEGTWSPSVSNATFSSIAAYYLKIGRMCTVWFRISGGGSYNGSNTVGVSNLPFTASSSGTHMVGSSEYYKIDFARDYTSHCTPYINNGTSTIYWLRNASSGGSGNYLTANLFHSGAAITTTLTYQTT